MFPDNKIMIKKDNNKNGEEVSVFLSPKESLFENEPNFLTIPTREGKMQLNFQVYRIDKNSIYLSDILVPKGHNQGYGNILLKALIELSKENGFKKIIGQMHQMGETEEEREEHKKNQISFYKNHGFEIKEGNNIVKIL